MSELRYEASEIPAHWNIVDGDGLRLCNVHTRQIARRLVACWNVCDGIPTEYLERVEPTGEAALFAEELMRDRDELIAALQRMVNRYDTDGGEPLLPEYKNARALLDKHAKEPA